MLGVGFEPQCRVVLGGIVAGHQNLFVGFTVPVGVLHPPQFGGLGNQCATVGQVDGAWHHELVGEDRAGVHTAVAIGVREDDDGPGGVGFTARLLVGHVADHFHHPQAPLGIELHGNRRVHQRFSRHHLHRESRRQAEGADLVGR